MSLTSYRAAPPRDEDGTAGTVQDSTGGKTKAGLKLIDCLNSAVLVRL
jgi:hypothetical protein